VVIINDAGTKDGKILFFVVEETPEGGYEARAVGTSIFTEAETLEELEQRIRDAVVCHFEDPASRLKIQICLISGSPVNDPQ